MGVNWGAAWRCVLSFAFSARALATTTNARGIKVRVYCNTHQDFQAYVCLTCVCVWCAGRVHTRSLSLVPAHPGWWLRHGMDARESSVLGPAPGCWSPWGMYHSMGVMGAAAAACARGARAHVGHPRTTFISPPHILLQYPMSWLGTWELGGPSEIARAYGLIVRGYTPRSAQTSLLGRSESAVPVARERVRRCLVRALRRA